MPLVQMERELALLRQAVWQHPARDLSRFAVRCGPGALPPAQQPSAIEYAAGELRLRGLSRRPQELSDATNHRPRQRQLRLRPTATACWCAPTPRQRTAA